MGYTCSKKKKKREAINTIIKFQKCIDNRKKNKIFFYFLLYKRNKGQKYSNSKIKKYIY